MKTQTDLAAFWLEEYLKGDGPVPSREVVGAGIAMGFSQAAIHRARQRLGVEVVNQPVTPRTTTWELHA